MVQEFQSFVYILFIVGAVLGFGLVFEKQAIAIEDKIDAWFFRVFHIKLPFGKE